MTNAWRDGTVTVGTAADMETRIRAHTELDRFRQLTVAQGLIAESYPKCVQVSSSAGGSGQLLLVPWALIGGETITSLTEDIANTPSGLTQVRMVIYDVSGNLLASSADVKANYTTSGTKTSLLQVPYTPAADMLALIGHFTIGTTCPAASRQTGMAAANGHAFSGGTLHMAYIQNGLGALPNLATLSPTNILIWNGIS